MAIPEDLNSRLRGAIRESSGTPNQPAMAVANPDGSDIGRGTYLEAAGLSAGALNADLIPSMDVSAYKWLILQIIGTWVGTLTFQGSNDNTNWSSIALAPIGAQVSGGALGAFFESTAANRQLAGPINFRYLRVRMTSYTSGTAAGVLELHTIAPPALQMFTYSKASQDGTWTVQPGNTPNTTAWMMRAAAQTDALYNGATALTPKFAFANIAASTTDGAIVAAVASKKIRVLDYKVMAGATATNATFNSKPGGAGSAISMTHACPANGGTAPGYNPLGHFETGVGEGLAITTGAGSTVGVQITYVEV